MTSARPTAGELERWDHAHLWHPFTQMQEWLAAPPLVIERAEGNYLIDIHGRRYLDGVSSLWCNVHGHRKPELDAALRAQVDRVAHSTMLGLSNVPAIELAQQLVGIAPAGLTRVFYSDSGATAVEIALKIAYQYRRLTGAPERDTFVSLTESYHGDTLGAVSVGYSETFHHHFRPLLFPCQRLNPPHVFRWHRQESPERALVLALAEAEDLFARCGKRIAALIIEPMMQGAAGMWAQPRGYIAGLRELTRRYGALLICDEVATGFGRTGRMFAVEHDRVSPDILCLGKGITGGYLPLAATLTTEEIFRAFLGSYAEHKQFFHGHTYTGNPLACAVAVENLQVFAREGVVARADLRSAQLSDLLDRQVAGLAHVGDIRQWGLMVGIELVREEARRIPYAAGERVGARVAERARRLGVILRPLADAIVLMPPLSITEDELVTLCGVVRQAIAEVTGEPLCGSLG
ncbi:MAG: adenosylmethionine--8-amino-7-oxononanoate transaminase [Deltaproteobacteria bacterium]|nr:adenosylmethionine--8-amino-7-oxononanoate transaminase [Deltaproteobacteria bacterium]